jgi:hypothetical protein
MEVIAKNKNTVKVMIELLFFGYYVHLCLLLWKNHGTFRFMLYQFNLWSERSYLRSWDSILNIVLLQLGFVPATPGVMAASVRHLLTVDNNELTSGLFLIFIEIRGAPILQTQRIQVSATSVFHLLKVYYANISGYLYSVTFAASMCNFFLWTFF